VPQYNQNRATHDASGVRIAVAVAMYHPEVVGPLEQGACDAFLEAGGSRTHLCIMPCAGAWELPSALAAMQDRLEPTPDAFVALGCVIKGDTSHDRWITGAVCSELAGLSVRLATPVGMGILTCDTMEQARERSGGARGNKGREAMLAVIQQIHEANDLQWGLRQ
jgi:6,7-dimethyl-8-ribityllumazine synthase